MTQLKLHGYAQVEAIETTDTGGHCLVDILTLADGRVLVIDSESMGMYTSRKAFDDGEGALDTIDLLPKPAPQEVWCCARCGGTNVFYDAFVNCNDPEDVRTYDATTCADCGDEVTTVLK